MSTTPSTTSNTRPAFAVRDAVTLIEHALDDHRHDVGTFPDGDYRTLRFVETIAAVEESTLDDLTIDVYLDEPVAHLPGRPDPDGVLLPPTLLGRFRVTVEQVTV